MTSVLDRVGLNTGLMGLYSHSDGSWFITATYLTAPLQPHLFVRLTQGVLFLSSFELAIQALEQAPHANNLPNEKAGLAIHTTSDTSRTCI
jgi:hypothetical protein